MGASGGGSAHGLTPLVGRQVMCGQWAVGSSGGEGDVGEKAAGSGEWSVVSGQ
jgi:hypothetical protein